MVWDTFGSVTSLVTISWFVVSTFYNKSSPLILESQYRHLEPLFKAYAQKSSQPARVLWTSSLESSPEGYSHDDWQLIKTKKSYEGSKYELDLIGHRLSLRSQKLGPSAPIRHMVIHPGLAQSNMSINMVGGFLDLVKVLYFYVVSMNGELDG